MSRHHIYESNMATDWDWDPMLTDYQDPQFNAYTQGVGSDLIDGSGRGTKLFVDNFPVESGQEGLYNLFSEFGRVINATLKRSNREDGKLSFGFVTMDSAVHAEHAISQMNKRPLRSGIPLIVRPALTDAQKKQREERKQIEMEFMSNLGKSNFNRDDDMISSVSAINRSSADIYDERVLTARAKALLERTRQDMVRYNTAAVERPVQFGRGRAQSFRNSSYLQGLGAGHDHPHGFGGRARGGGGRLDIFERPPRPGPSLGPRPGPRPGFGKGSIAQMVQPKKPKLKNLKICLQCGAEDSAYRCQACKSYYCSHECQRKDWPRHKDICLDINLHNFNSKYCQPQIGMEQQHKPMRLAENKPIQDHQHHSGSGYNSDREFEKSNNHHSDKEEGGKGDFGGRRLREINRGYESEACGGGGGSYLKKQNNKMNSYNKAENRNNVQDQESSQTRGNRGRYQERNSGFKGKDEDNDYHAEKDSNFTNNKSDGFKRKEKENYRENRQETKVFTKSNDNDRDSRSQRSQTQKNKFDNKNTPPAKANNYRKDQPGQDRRDTKPKSPAGTASDFNFNSVRDTESEKSKPARKDMKSVKKSEEVSGGREKKAKGAYVEDVGSGDASSDLIALTMEVGTKQKCYVTHYDNPSKFWIALGGVEMVNFLDKSHQWMKLLSESPMGQVKKVKAGDVYCMIDTDIWARVKIVTVGRDGDLTVFFPDVGKQESIHTSQLFPMDDEMMRLLPAQAMWCCVGGAKSKGRMWSEKAKNAVAKWLGEPYNKELSFTVLERRGNTHALEIFNGKEKLSEFLISDGLAEPGDKSANLPKLSNKEGSPKPAENTRFMAKDLKGFAADLEKNEKISVVVTDLKNLTHYIGQVVNAKTRDALGQITGTLNGLNLDGGTPYSPVVGELVLARFSEDGSWYRSEVSRIKGDKFLVTFLDYGNAEEVNAESIRKLEEMKLTTYPALALSLQLADVDPTAVQEKESLIDMDTLVADFGLSDTATAVIKGKKGSSLIVDLISKDNKSLSELLNKPLSKTPASKQKQETAAVKSLSRDTLPMNAHSQVLVNFVNSCSSFYVVHIDNSDAFVDLISEINGNVKSLQICDNPVVGRPVVANFEGTLYRANIRKVLENGKKCEVFYLDYGNCAEVSSEELYQLPQWAYSQPAFAIHCSLDVDSVNLSPNADSEFKVFENEVVKVSVIRKEEDGNKCIVKVHTDDGDILQELTVNFETKNSISPSKSSPPVTSSHPSQASKESALIKPELLPVSEVPVMSIVSHAESVCEFYIQTASSNIEKLDTIMAEVSAVASELPQVKDVSVGTQCTAKFIEDDAWYRAEVISSVENNDTCILKFVDYGNRQETPKRELRELPEYAKDLCALAVPCCFKEFEQYLGEGQEQDLNVIHNGIDFDKMKADIKSDQVLTTVHSHKSGLCIVTLEDTEGSSIVKKHKVETQVAEATHVRASPPTATLSDIRVREVTESDVQVICTNMETITEFSCQPAGDCETQALQISETLKEDLANVDPGRCVAVKGGVYGCTFENLWYRCVVEEVAANQVVIRYIDWGNMELRDVADLRHLQPKHLSFPITLMKCCLHGIMLIDDDEDTRIEEQKYIKFLSEKVQSTGKLALEIVSKEVDVYKVVLFLISDDNRLNINNDLVQTTNICKKEEDDDDVEEQIKKLQREMEELKMKKSKKK